MIFFQYLMILLMAKLEMNDRMWRQSWVYYFADCNLEWERVAHIVISFSENHCLEFSAVKILECVRSLDVILKKGLIFINRCLSKRFFATMLLCGGR